MATPNVTAINTWAGSHKYMKARSHKIKPLPLNPILDKHLASIFKDEGTVEVQQLKDTTQRCQKLGEVPLLVADMAEANTIFYITPVTHPNTPSLSLTAGPRVTFITMLGNYKGPIPFPKSIVDYLNKQKIAHEIWQQDSALHFVYFKHPGFWTMIFLVYVNWLDTYLTPLLSRS